MLYVFILGREPTLSLAEIISVLGPSAQVENYSPEFCLINTSQKPDVDFLMGELGGVIKIGVVDYTNNVGMARIEEMALAKLKVKAKGGQKVFFGLSGYGGWDKSKLQRLGLRLKSNLAKEGVNSRLVVSQAHALSAVVIKTNKLLSSRGLDLLLLKSGEKLWLGETLAVQPFDQFSERDFGRPGHDAYSGMLPPKLAKMMVNLAEMKKNKILLDPFCGSGTILTEAAVMGYQQLIGSDLSARAVENTKKNMEWLRTKFSIFNSQFSIKVCDVANLTECFGEKKVDAIVTEPWLGPPLRGKESTMQIKKNMSDLEEVYVSAFKSFVRVLRQGGTVVMVWPFFVLGTQKYFLPIVSAAKTLGLSIIPALPSRWSKLLSDRQTLTYLRPNQRVGREIVKLVKK